MRHVLALVAALALVCLVVWVVFFSPLFALDPARVRVTGVEGDVATRVAALVDDQVGVPLPRLSESRIRERASGIVEVRSVEVLRRWPSGVELRVTPRTAVMGARTDSGFDLVDETGVVFGHADEAPAGAPVVEISASEDMRARAAEQVMTVWGSLSEAMRGQVALIRTDGRQASLELADGRTAQWGTSDESALKGRVLEVLVGQRQASHYDVSSPTRPVTS